MLRRLTHFFCFLITLLFVWGCGTDYHELSQHRTRVVYENPDPRSDNLEPSRPMPEGGEDNPTSDPTGDDDEPNVGEEIDDPNSDVFKLAGEVRSITSLGEIYGWALNEDDLDARLEVHFYIDGPPGTGTLAGSTMANEAGFTGGFNGNYAYQFQLPEAYRNAAERRLFVYTSIEEVQAPVVSNVIRFTAYAPSQAGRNYYQNTLRPLLVNNCGGCHPAANEITYDNHYLLLLSPSPASGGTATSNLLINKSANIVEHRGNNRCGGQRVNGNPCSQMQQWWNLEFGN